MVSSISLPVMAAASLAARLLLTAVGQRVKSRHRARGQWFQDPARKDFSNVKTRTPGGSGSRSALPAS